MSVVTCGYCGENRVKERNKFVWIECVHDIWCGECKQYKERLDREMAQEREFKNGYDKCGKKWVGTLRYKGICKVYHVEGKKEKEIPKKEKERVLRCTMRPLREVWIRIGMKKIDTYEGIIVMNHLSCTKFFSIFLFF